MANFRGDVMGYFIKPKQLYLGNNFIPIPNVFKLDRVGAGHDGFVYRDDDVAYKVLKHDIDERKVRGLMSFEKARTFSTLDVKRFAKPIDVLIDEKHRDYKLLSYLAYEEDKDENILEDPSLLKTPIVRNGKLATVGYQPEVWQKWLEAEK